MAGLPKKGSLAGHRTEEKVGLVVCLVEEEREIGRAPRDRSFTDMKCPSGPLLDITA